MCTSHRERIDIARFPATRPFFSTKILDDIHVDLHTVDVDGFFCPLPSCSTAANPDLYDGGGRGSDV